ncbi:class A beta-lactamase-related serine hydrolase [Streptococcus australis]|uniref:serine hydrolase n=1 Tax=Streptococcus australis TaxID=113107 RepID=UPI001CBD2B22|nr:serine hydrolase [Streptococcus australis]MBZ2154292.1 class A beta-lactamase-related serine hydrolase [Streptococcus australis]
MHKLIYFFLLPSFLVTKPLSDQKTPVTPLVSDSSYPVQNGENVHYFVSLPSNPNVYQTIVTYTDPELSQKAGEIKPDTPFTVEQLFVNEQGQSVFKLGNKQYVVADQDQIFEDNVLEISEEKKTLWLTGDFTVYDKPLMNGAKVKKTSLTPYSKVEITKSAKTLKGTYLEISGQGWISKDELSATDNRMEKVQAILNQKYNKDGIAVYVKQVDTGKTAGIHEDQEMYSASIAKLLYLYYTQKELNENHVDLQTPLKYTKEVNDYPGAYEPEGSGSISKTPDDKEYTVADLINRVAKESDNVAQNILGYYVTHQSDKEFQKVTNKIAGKTWNVENRMASAKMAGNVMEAIYQQNAGIIDALSDTRFDDQRISKDIPVKVAHKIGDAYDFRHDVAIVYTDSPFILAIFTDHSDYETISAIAKDIYEVLQ